MKKTIGIIVALLSIGAAVTGVYWKWFRVAQEHTTQERATVPLSGDLSSGVTAEVVGDAVSKDQLMAKVQQPTDASQPVQRTAEEEERLSIGNLARSFTERMGSYSPSTNYDNLRQLFPLMSVTMRTWAEGVIARGGKTELSVRMTAFAATEDSARRTADTRVYTVATQKEIRSTATATAKMAYQKAIVVLVKSEDSWLVDSVTWGTEGDL